MTLDIVSLYGVQFVGIPYKWGGDDPMLGFDCSGLVLELLKAGGLVPPATETTAQGIFDMFKANEKPVTETKHGDLVFFGSNGKIIHVGFCLSDKLMLEAGGGGSQTNTPQDAAKQNAYIRVRPIRNRSDLVKVVQPNWG